MIGLIIIMGQTLMLLAVIFNFICLIGFIYYHFFLQKKKDKRIKELEEMIKLNDKKRKVSLNNTRVKMREEMNNKLKDTEENIANIMETYRTQISTDVTKITNPTKWPYSK